MNQTMQVVDPEALRRVETVYRSRIITDPCDTMARGRLAWCLFIQSLHKAGQESVIQALSAVQVDAATFALNAHGPEAQQLLDECLRHTEAVMQFCSGEERSEMERLLGLARLSIGSTAMAAAEDRAHEILQRLMRDLSDPSQIKNDGEDDGCG